MWQCGTKGPSHSVCFRVSPSCTVCSPIVSLSSASFLRVVIPRRGSNVTAALLCAAPLWIPAVLRHPLACAHSAGDGRVLALAVFIGKIVLWQKGPCVATNQGFSAISLNSMLWHSNSSPDSWPAVFSSSRGGRALLCLSLGLAKRPLCGHLRMPSVLLSVKSEYEKRQDVSGDVPKEREEKSQMHR